MKLKFDENGHVVLQDGKPVYIHDDGKEIAFDGAQAFAKIGQLTSENKSHRTRADELDAKIKQFEGIEDPAAARKALETLKNLDDKKLVDAGEVEKIRTEAIKAVEDKYAPVIKERDELQASLVAEKVGGSFARSQFITEKLAIPADLAQARFGEAFKVEGGQVVAYDKSGNKLYSRANPGELAGFDEAFEMLIEAYPHRDAILKSSGAFGSGAKGGNGGGSGSKSINRAAFENLSPAERMEFSKGGGSVTD